MWIGLDWIDWRLLVSPLLEGLFTGPNLSFLSLGKVGNVFYGKLRTIEECQALEKCVCSLCKCCLNCGNKCKCDFANTGADDSRARILLPEISDDYL